MLRIGEDIFDLIDYLMAVVPGGVRPLPGPDLESEAPRQIQPQTPENRSMRMAPASPLYGFVSTRP